MNLIPFPTAYERWLRSFKKTATGEFSEKLFELERRLEDRCWEVNLFADVAEFHTYVDFEARVIYHNNPKANLTYYVLSHIWEMRNMKIDAPRVLYTFENGESHIRSMKLGESIPKVERETFELIVSP